ncbi:solute carrier family 22 member 13-like [Arapaima gigas]
MVKHKDPPLTRSLNFSSFSFQVSHQALCHMLHVIQLSAPLKRIFDYFSNVLSAAGDFGVLQKLLLLALCYPDLQLSCQAYSLLFTQAGFPYRCDVDQILNVNPNLTTEEKINRTLPRREDGSLESCRMFAPMDWDIEAIGEHGLSKTTGCLHGWVSDTSSSRPPSCRMCVRLRGAREDWLICK